MKKIRLAAWNILGPYKFKEGLMPEGITDSDSEKKILTLLEEEKPDFAFLQEVPPMHCMDGLAHEHFSERISSRAKEDYCRGIMFYQADPSCQCELHRGPAEFPAAAGLIVRAAAGNDGKPGKELFRILGIWNAPLTGSSQEIYFGNFTAAIRHFRDFCTAAENLIIVGDTNLILHAEAYADDPQALERCRKMRDDLAGFMKTMGLPQVCTVADNADTLTHNGWFHCDLLFVSDSLRDGLRTDLGRRDLYIDKLKSDHVPILAEFHI